MILFCSTFCKATKVLNNVYLFWNSPIFHTETTFTPTNSVVFSMSENWWLSNCFLPKTVADKWLPILVSKVTPFLRGMTLLLILSRKWALRLVTRTPGSRRRFLPGWGAQGGMVRDQEARQKWNQWRESELRGRTWLLFELLCLLPFYLIQTMWAALPLVLMPTPGCQ